MFYAIFTGFVRWKAKLLSKSIFVSFYFLENLLGEKSKGTEDY